MSGNNLTLTGASFDTSAQKLGTAALNGGYGRAASSIATAYPYTLEGWVKMASNPGAVKVAVGSTNMAWFGVDASGHAQSIVGSGGSPAQITTTKSLVDNVWHHVALVVASNGTTQLFVDGISVGTSSAASTASVYTDVLGVGTYGTSTGYDWTGSTDEVVVWPTAKYTTTFTPPSSPYTGSEGMLALYHLDSNGTDSSTGASTLAIGTLTATPSQASIVLSLSAGLSSGSGTGYGYAIYRGTDPNFTANSGSLLATVSSMPYTDSTAVAGTEYYYGVVGSDSTAATVKANPASIGSWAPSYVPYVAAQLQTTALNIVFEGDSITNSYGVTNAGTMTLPTMPAYCVQKLKRLLGIRTINASNKGFVGYTTTDWAPAGSAFAASKTAMNSLVSSNPTAQPVFSIMLGTNDSATAGTNNSPSGSLTAAQYQTNLKAIITQHLADFPTCKVIAHMPPYYTPNTHNTATYEQAGLSALVSYRAAITAAVASYAGSNPGQVFVGDTYAFQYFAQNYAAELQADTSGPNGSFYLHPAGTAGTNGLIGTQSLGEMHAQAIAQALYGTVSAGVSHSFF